VTAATWTRVTLDFTTQMAADSLTILVTKNDKGAAFCDNLGLPRNAGTSKTLDK